MHGGRKRLIVNRVTGTSDPASALRGFTDRASLMNAPFPYARAVTAARLSGAPRSNRDSFLR